MSLEFYNCSKHAFPIYWPLLQFQGEKKEKWKRKNISHSINLPFYMKKKKKRLVFLPYPASPSGESIAQTF